MPPIAIVVVQDNIQSRNGGLFWLRLAVDALHHNDCLENGGLGATSPSAAHDNCRPNSIYASARAFEPGL